MFVVIRETYTATFRSSKHERTLYASAAVALYPDVADCALGNRCNAEEPAGCVAKAETATPARVRASPIGHATRKTSQVHFDNTQ